MKVYFDNAATTVVRSEAIEATFAAMTTDYGNPSSSHEFGRRAALMLERARNSVAEALGAKPKCIYFTSGGTESNNLAIFGTVRNRSLGRKVKASNVSEALHIITSSIEHDSVMIPIKQLENEGFEVTYLAPDSAGRISSDAFAQALRENTVFASVMLVNNETGAVNPVADYAAEIKRRKLNTLLHTDAVQGFCKIPFNVKSLGADLISSSAHKLHGLKGAGTLYVSEKVKLSPIIFGAAQEKGLRAGTEALPAIIGFGEAVRFGYTELAHTAAAVGALRELAAGLLTSVISGAVIIGDGDSPYILCFSLPGFKSEVLLNFLDSAGICVSKGSACKKGVRSHVLEAMKLPYDIIDGALRVSFSRYSTKEEVEYFIRKLKKASETLVH